MEVGSAFGEKFNFFESPNDDENNSNQSIALAATTENKIVAHENSDIDLRLQAQEHMYRITLTREKNKVSMHALEEVGRSITAISQRRRQYFLDYKTCDSIRQIRHWFAWESKRNLDANHSSETKSENAATRGLKGFLSKIEFYGTLLTRFGEYLIDVLLENYTVDQEENYEVSKTKDKIFFLQEKCQTLLSDNHEVVLDSQNYTEIENKFPVISILRQVHDTLCQMTDLATLWRVHARFADRFESVSFKRSALSSVQQLDDKKEAIRNLESRIRISKYDMTEIERELRGREAAMQSNEFCEVYNKCTDRIEELSDMADNKKLEVKSLDTTIKYLHEKTETYKKMVQHKRKQKLEMNVRKREERVKELNAIMMEIARLEEHKKMLDLKEEMWLRGGFEQELGVMQDLKNKLLKFRRDAEDLEQQTNDEKDDYHKTTEQIIELDAEYERLSREYEYVKRLSTTMLPVLWKVNVISQHPINSVKPNKVSAEKAESEDAYIMTQPKGVAMIISNDEKPSAQLSTKPSFLTNHSPQPSADASLKTPSENVPVAVTSITSLCAQLGFYIMPRHRLSSEALHRNMAAMSDQYHNFACNLNSLFVIVNDKSDEYGRSLGAGETKQPISVSQYLEHFTHARCPSLMGRPKVFLFLLRVTEHDPKLPVVGPFGSKNTRKQINSLLSSTHSSTSNVFKPEPIDVAEFGEDILVVRIMHQTDGGGDAAPTFGGTSSSDRNNLPWHMQILIGTLMEQASNKDFLSILEYVKEEIAFGPKARASPTTKIESGQEDVEIFIDHSLKKKLYFMPGI